MATLSPAVIPKYLGAISTRIADNRKGSYLFKIVGYPSHEGISVGEYTGSDIFTIGRYNWIITYHPHGEDYVHFSIWFRSRVRGITVKFNLTLLARDGKASSNFECPTKIETYIVNPWRLNFHIRRKKLEDPKFLKGDSFRVRCTIEVIKDHLEAATIKFFEVPPSNLGQQLTNLLETEERADVSFKVGGDTIHAHKFMLAARLPVFKAQLFGPMNCKKNKSIEVKDMEASVFKAMLHFIYSDSESLPEFNDLKGNKAASIALAQHLLVAADRYGLERLKYVCETTLFQFVDVDNVGTTLAFAEQHNCSVLKAACIDFVQDPDYINLLRKLREKI